MVENSSATDTQKRKKIDALTERNVEAIVCSEAATRKQAPWIYRVVGAIASYCGTVGFLIGNGAFFVLWIVANETVLTLDPYPYTFLLFAVSLEAIFLSVLILISQNMAAAESERRHHLDLQINLLSEREMTALLRLAAQIATAVGVPDEEQAEVRQFAHNTDPAVVLQQIRAAESRHNVNCPPFDDSSALPQAAERA